MNEQEKDSLPMLSCNRKLPTFHAKSASMTMPPNASYDNEDTCMSHTGPLRIRRTSEFGVASSPLNRNRRSESTFWLAHGKPHNRSSAIVPEVFVGENISNIHPVMRNEHLLMSGPLGLCDNPDCTECPAAYKTKRSYHNTSVSLDQKLHNILYGDDDSLAKKLISGLRSYFPIMNPHTKVVQDWNKLFVISCFIAIFIDPLFFFLLSIEEKYECIIFNSSLATTLVVVRSLTDFIYLLHMILQFRLAYVAPESRVVGAGDLIDEPKKIALYYLRTHFLLDLFVVLPLPQVMILAAVPHYVGSSEANYAQNLLRVTVLLQYIPRIVRFLPLLSGHSASGFIFESAWANFVINLLMFVLAGHVVGSSWYLLGLQRVNQCLQDACSSSHIPSCNTLIDCGRGHLSPVQAREQWAGYVNSTKCFKPEEHQLYYGIYKQVVLLTTEDSVVKRYIYSLFWGFQQISTLAGNQEPSYFEWEVLFTMAIVGLGLLLFALLIGNMQNFLQALGRRTLEMQLRQRDVERWMSHRRLPESLRGKVRQAERFSWVATRGVNEEQLLDNLPEDIQREIRRHFFKFLNKVRIFSLMDTPVLDAVCEKLRQKVFIRGSDILYEGGPVEKMIFVIRGKLESIGADGNVAPLSEGDVCGEELLTWYLEHPSMSREGGKIRSPGLFSTRTVVCVTNVEAFALQAADLEEVTKSFSRFLRNPRLQGAIRYESPYWRNMAATRIQVAWRYRQRHLRRTRNPNTASVNSTSRPRR